MTKIMHFVFCAVLFLNIGILKKQEQKNKKTKKTIFNRKYCRIDVYNNRGINIIYKHFF